LHFDTRHKGCVVRLDGRLCRTPVVHMGGHDNRLRPTGPVRLLATPWRAIERIAPGRLKRDAANHTGVTLHTAIASKVPHVAILTKAAGVYARRFAFDTKAIALTVLTVQDVAIAAKSAGVYPLHSAFDAMAVPHVTIEAKAAGVYARRFAFGAKVLALAVGDKPRSFQRRLLICDGHGGTSLMVVTHIASPTHTVNEIGAGYAAPRTLCDGRLGAPLMVVAHIASPTHPLNETGAQSVTPWTFDF
jgi:hypothetical protein